MEADHGWPALGLTHGGHRPGRVCLRPQPPCARQTAPLLGVPHRQGRPRRRRGAAPPLLVPPFAQPDLACAGAAAIHAGVWDLVCLLAVAAIDKLGRQLTSKLRRPLRAAGRSRASCSTRPAPLGEPNWPRRRRGEPLRGSGRRWRKSAAWGTSQPHGSRRWTQDADQARRNARGSSDGRLWALALACVLGNHSKRGSLIWASGIFFPR